MATLASILPAGGGAFRARSFGINSHVADDNAEVLEREKQRQLADPSGPAAWSELLASDSEAVRDPTPLEACFVLSLLAPKSGFHAAGSAESSSDRVCFCLHST